MAQSFYISSQVILKAPDYTLALHKSSFSDGTKCDIWGLPGGKIDTDETEIETIRRELIEELDYDIKDMQPQFINYIFPGEIDFRFKDNNGIVALIFEVNIPKKFEPKLSTENDQYLWLDHEEFLEKEFFSIKVKMKDIYKN